MRRWLIVLCIIYVVCPASQAEVFRSEELGIRFVSPRFLELVDPSEITAPMVTSVKEVSEVALAKGVEDVLESPGARLLRVSSAEGVSFIAAFYPEKIAVGDRNRLEEQVLSLFALSDHFLNSLLEPGKMVFAPLDINGLNGALYSRAFTESDTTIRTWTALYNHPKGALVMRFTVVMASEEVAWPDYHEEVTRCLQTVGLDEPPGNAMGRNIKVLGIFVAAFLIFRAVRWVLNRREEEQEEVYEAELEETFGKTFPAVEPTRAGTVLAQPLESFEFPPKIRKAIESRDIYGALILARELLAVAREMKDPRAEATYRECINRIEVMQGNVEC